MLDEPATERSGRRRPVGPRHGERPPALSVRVGVDVYNASDDRPDRNLLRWSGAPQGWEVQPQPVEIPAMATYMVRRETLDASFDLARPAPPARRPVEMTFTNGFTNRDSVLRLVLPVAASERLEGRRVATDGRFDEWDDADLIHSGPLVQMVSRPTVQRRSCAPLPRPQRFTPPGRRTTFTSPSHSRGSRRRTC